MQFWVYVLTAIRRAVGDEIGTGALALLQASSAPIEAAVSLLLNDLLTLATDVVLVLDDYHVIESHEVHESVEFLLARLPAHMHLLMATRADPPLPLGRLRVEGRLVEVRAADLRFTADETAAYLAGATGATISPTDVGALAERTEGWIAALQLAALSMQGRDDVSTFIAEFAGDDRYIVDYLAEEVLDRQPADTRQFLLETSVLGRMNGSLCDAVTGQTGGNSQLERLERANMFLVPLDDRRQWYRYHHLFGDVLQAHLLDEHQQAVPELHARASAWLASNGQLTDAIVHSLAAGDPERAADLAEASLPAWRRDRQEASIRTWVQLLPEEVVRKRPLLIVALIGSGAALGQFAPDVGDRLDEAERLVNLALHGSTPSSDDVVIADETQLPALPAAIEMYRAALALVRGDLEGTVTHGRRAVAMAPNDDHLERAGAAALVGLASWTRGDIDGAIDGYSQSIDGLSRAGHIADVLGCSITLADLRLAQGRLRDAFTIYTDALALSVNAGGEPLRGTADMHVGLSEVHLERDEVDAASEHLQKSQDLGEHNGLPQHPYRWRLAMARLREAEGDVAAAVELLDDAERVYTTDFSPSVRPIPAVRAGMLATHGHLPAAIAWVHDRSLACDDDLEYLTEFEHIALAKVTLARFRAERSPELAGDAVRLLERLLASAHAGGRMGVVLQVVVLLALTEDARGDRAGALARLGAAVELAEPEGYVRVFLDEGQPMRILLSALTEGRSGSYASRLLQTRGQHAPDPPAAQWLIDPLSERELDVLRLLGTDLSGPEIARELTVSLNTVRTHTKSIYSKLGVTSRRAAVRHADELKLLSRPARP
ncbi:MAG: LuxR C-terminal-related transcriptional regulator [Actinomycetota bacterium]|nr:LuxR C-terminal-related transcriptional regulator [Actinomycetota bacterium]